MTIAPAQLEDPSQGPNPMTGSRPIVTLPSRPDRPIGRPPTAGERIVAPSAPPRPTLTAKRLKVTLVLNADELAAVPVEDGKPRARLRIPFA
jgi:hypothetical protein